MLCQAIMLLAKAFWPEFDIAHEVNRALLSGSPESRKWLRDRFADARMLA